MNPLPSEADILYRIDPLTDNVEHYQFIKEHDEPGFWMVKNRKTGEVEKMDIPFLSKTLVEAIERDVERLRGQSKSIEMCLNDAINMYTDHQVRLMSAKSYLLFLKGEGRYKSEFVAELYGVPQNSERSES
jgi:hypothetical protein